MTMGSSIRPNRQGVETVADSYDHHMKLLAERARSVLQDDHVKQAAGVTKDVAARAGQASKTVTRKVTQEDAWDVLRGDVELLTEIARAHHALIVDLIDRTAELEKQAGSRDGG
jgi:hypothetical protein